MSENIPTLEEFRAHMKSCRGCKAEQQFHRTLDDGMVECSFCGGRFVLPKNDYIDGIYNKKYK